MFRTFDTSGLELFTSNTDAVKREMIWYLLNAYFRSTAI